MKIAIFYFSGTGNTWWVSQQLKTELEQLNHTVNLYSLENPRLNDPNFMIQEINSAGHIIIGFPVYGSDLPENVNSFLKSIPSTTKKKKFSIFCTEASFAGDATMFFKHDIENKGYLFKQSFQIKMTTNFNVAMFPFSLSKPAEGKKLEEIKNKAKKKIKKIAKYIDKDKKYLEGKRVYQVILGKIQRYFFNRTKKKLPKHFKFSEDKCIKCHLCATTCPTNNITLEINAEAINLKRDNRCILCFRCYNFCPSCAINYGRNVKHPEKYKRYKGPIENLKLTDIQK